MLDRSMFWTSTGALGSGRIIGRFRDKTPEQEKAERRRQVPYPRHINLDLFEGCHLISAMLLEIPKMAAASVGDFGNHRRARPINIMIVRPSSIYWSAGTDSMMRASKALITGDWKACVELCTQLEVWQLVPGEGVVASIQAMLKEKIKLEGLRTYLFAFSAQYDSLSLSQLCGMFEMTKKEVHNVVSRMMINRELFASWDQPTETIVLRKVEPNSLQLMALQFAEKAANLVEANERLLDVASGNLGYREDWKSGDHGDDRGHRGGHQRNDNRGQRNDGRGSRGFRRDGGGGSRGGGRGGGRQGRPRQGGGNGGGGRGSGSGRGRGGGGGRRGEKKY